MESGSTCVHVMYIHASHTTITGIMTMADKLTSQIKPDSVKSNPADPAIISRTIRLRAMTLAVMKVGMTKALPIPYVMIWHC